MRVNNDDTLRSFKRELEGEIKNSSKIFIVGHNSPDFDAIGSAIGLYSFIKRFGKESYIIVNDDPAKIESGAKKIIDDNRDIINIIDKRECLELLDNNSMLIVTDTNKPDKISVGDSIDLFNKIAVIDHHFKTNESIKTTLIYINSQSSSASEIVTRMLNMSKVKYGGLTANYLLAGISLDTDRFKKNTTALTHDVAEKLIRRGADMNFVNNLFLQDFNSFCHVASLIIYDNTIRKIYTDSLPPIQVSFSLNREAPKSIYKKEDCAKAADRMMKFIDTDASFVMGYIDARIVHVSARGGKRVNVGKIMESVGGGGNFQNAGVQIETNDIFEIEQELINNVPLGISSSEDIINPLEIRSKQLAKRSKK